MPALPLPGEPSLSMTSDEMAMRLEALDGVAGASLELALREARYLESELMARFPKHHAWLAILRTKLARYLVELGRPAEAIEPATLARDLLKSEVSFARQRSVRTQKAGEFLFEVTETLGRAYRESGALGSGRDLYRQFAAEAPFHHGPLLGWARLESAAGEPAEAARLYRRAIDLYARGSKENVLAFRAVMLALAARDKACQLAGSLPRTMGRLEETERVKRIGGCSNLRSTLDELGQARTELADLLAAQGDARGVIELYNDAKLTLNEGFHDRRVLRQMPSPPVVAGAVIPVDMSRRESEEIHARFAGALAAAGELSLAREAMLVAIESNAKRLRTSAALWTPSVQFPLHADRRALIAQLHAVSVKQGTAGGDAELIDLVADSQGSVIRMLEHQRLAVATIDSPELRQAARRLEELDRKELTLDPSAGVAFVHDLTMLNAERINTEMKIRPLIAQDAAALLPPARGLAEQLAGALGDRILIGFASVAGRPTDPAHYVGYRIARGQPARLVHLGSAATVNLQVTRLRSEIRARLQNEESVAPPRAASTLFDTLLRPLLSDADLAAPEIVVVPDSELALLPFEVLVDATGRYMVERTAWRYLNSPRELLDERPSSPAIETAVVMGDPDYDSRRAAKGPAAPALMTLRIADGEALATSRFAPLPDTREEVERVAGLLQARGMKVSKVLGADLTRERLLAVQAPRILHIATHGFFSAGTTEPIAVKASNGMVVGHHVVDQPGLAAGLALAGANAALAAGGADAIAFASDLRRMNLRGTELVVLSACDTGVGRVEAGEGVQSLRSAVRESGAASVLASLWPVPSKATTALMVDFYRRMAEGRSPSAAIAEAKRSLIRAGFGPEAWAAFVLSGQ
jgi:CHAT domain-containing protein